jgi:hypothetical protein
VLRWRRKRQDQARVDALVARLGALPGRHSFRMDHGSGVMVCTRSG